jgi:phosphoribosylaminoimidazole-succinocarboxamide synthase
MTIDTLVTRKKVWLDTYHLLQQHGIFNHYIVYDFQDKYSDFNKHVYNNEHVELVGTELIVRDVIIAQQILSENNVPFDINMFDKYRNKTMN